MKLFVAALACAASLVLAQKKEAALNTEKQQVSYSIGVSIGQNFKIQEVDVDTDILLRGIKDALANANLRMTEQEMNECMNKFQTDMIAKQQTRQKISGGKNQQEGEAFLAENKKKDGVVTTSSGLQYKVVKIGVGAKPKSTDTVEVHYRGTTLDGKEFDSSYKHGQTTSFRLDQMIKGWIEGVQLMPVGSKFQFFIPSTLAFGERGAGADIGPNATVIFDVELISIK